MDLTLNARNLENHLNGKNEVSFYVPNLRKAFPSGNIELLKESKGGSLPEKTQNGAAFLHNTSIDKDTGQPYNVFIRSTDRKVKAYFKVPNNDGEYDLMAYCESRSAESIEAERKANQETMEDQQATKAFEELLEV